MSPVRNSETSGEVVDVEINAQNVKVFSFKEPYQILKLFDMAIKSSSKEVASFFIKTAANFKEVLGVLYQVSN